MRPGRAFVGAALVLLLAACGGDEPLTEPPTAQNGAGSASPSASAPPSPPSPSPSPSPPRPSPSPPPLSPFEADPAVQGLRSYLAAVAQAVNARDLSQPQLLARSTATRAAAHSEIYGSALEGWYPAPSPVAVLGVQVVSPTERSVAVCSPESGFLLDRAGGTPIDELEVLGGRFRMVLEQGVWKADEASGDDAIVCEGVPLQPALP